MGFNIPSSIAENCTFKCPDDSGPIHERWTHWVPGPGWASELWEGNRGQKSLLSPSKHAWYLEAVVHCLEGFYLLPRQRSSRFTTLPGKFLHTGLSCFCVLDHSCHFSNWNAFSVSVSHHRKPFLTTLPPRELFLLSEFLSHLVDILLFGTEPQSFLFCWLSFQLYVFWILVKVYAPTG